MGALWITLCSVGYVLANIIGTRLLAGHFAYSNLKKGEPDWSDFPLALGMVVLWPVTLGILCVAGISNLSGKYLALPVEREAKKKIESIEISKRLAAMEEDVGLPQTTSTEMVPAHEILDAPIYRNKKSGYRKVSW